AISEILREVWVRGPQHAHFRRKLQRRWNNKCAVTDMSCNGLLRASHIIPWSANELLRGDVDNGLLLCVPLDSLFDRGLISFDDSGRLIESSELHRDTAYLFGIVPGMQISW